MNTYYTVTKLDASRYRIYSKEQVFSDLLVGKDRALLFDTGYGYGNLKKVVKDITTLPLYIINSHGHMDHT